MKSKKISALNPKLFSKKLPNKKKNWDEIMKYNKNVSNNNKFILNGLRLIYVNDMMKTLQTKIGNDNCMVFKTGSTKLTSDLDIQVIFNICNDKTLKFYKNSINELVNLIKLAQDDWGKNFSFYLDVNFYPVGIFNYCLNPIKSDIVISVKDKDIYKTCFIPYLKNDKMILDFIMEDCKRIHNKPVKMTNKKLFLFYKKLYNNSVECFYKIIKNLKNKNIDYKLHNKLLLCITQFNNQGPEMYYSIGAIIIVVWYMQMKFSLTDDVIKILSISSYFENKIHYQNTKKEKYKIRMKKSYELMDQKCYKIVKKNLFL